MPRLSSHNVLLSSPLAVALLVLALLNPFCCHLLPFYEGESVIGKTELTDQSSVCIGKPDALSDRRVDLAPVLWLLVLTLGAAIFLIPRPIKAWRRKVLRSYAGPPRHKLFSVFLC